MAQDSLTNPPFGTAIATHLGNALQEIEKMMEEFSQSGGES